MCPRAIRIGAWVKPFAAFTPDRVPLYAWEPVLFTGGRQERNRWIGRDWVSAMPAVFRGKSSGVPGMKPEAFCWWLFDDLLGLNADDVLIDLYPGSGIVTDTWQRFQRQRTLDMTAEGLP